ncbi:hypothetical protein F4778DRAFT_758110 [Xylariomycetidae sp. FL2044]|nr:hypothetical protein F4778DRAFT_758110 [Xylariomycetidae sp. FL2044]
MLFCPPFSLSLSLPLPPSVALGSLGRSRVKYPTILLLLLRMCVSVCEASIYMYIRKARVLRNSRKNTRMASRGACAIGSRRSS